MGSEICCEETTKNEGVIEMEESKIIHRQVPEQVVDWGCRVK